MTAIPQSRLAQPRFPTILRSSLWFPLLLLVVALWLNYTLQDNLLELRVINRNLRNVFPLILLAAGQTFVIIGGGIDLSVGGIVSMVNSLLIYSLTPESPPEQVAGAIFIALAAGIAAGALNGFCVAILRLQPIVTTYATSFVFSGLALLILPRPGGAIPEAMEDLYSSTPGDIPFVLYMMALLILVWLFIRSTRYGQFLFANGSKADAAYASGVPVNQVRVSTYVVSGIFAALAGLALTMSLGTGNPRSGDQMTLSSVVAVVLGGTALRGGQGSVIGTIMGALVLHIIGNIISFASVPTWSQTLVDALIIIAALAGPGLLALIRKLVAR